MNKIIQGIFKKNTIVFQSRFCKKKAFNIKKMNFNKKKMFKKRY